MRSAASAGQGSLPINTIIGGNRISGHIVMGSHYH
jgi:hypothetical protein